MRHVLQGVPLVPGSDNCLLVCLRSYLSYMGVPAADTVLAREWGFYYSKGSSVMHSSIEASHLDRYDGLRRSGFSVEEIETDNSAEAWHETRRLLDEGKPVIVFVDPYYLPFWPLKTHTLHTLLVYGYDDRDQVWVMDGFNAISFAGPISLADYLSARESKDTADEHLPLNPGGAVRNRFLSIDTPCMAAYSVEHQVDEYIKNARLNSLCAIGPSGSLVGPDAVREFNIDFAETLRSRIDNGLLQEMWRKFSSLWVEKRLGKAVFETAYNVSNRLELQTLVSFAAKIERSWLIAAKTCLKMSYEEIVPAPDFLSSRIEMIANWEEEIQSGLATLEMVPENGIGD